LLWFLGRVLMLYHEKFVSLSDLKFGLKRFEEGDYYEFLCRGCLVDTFGERADLDLSL
jgi:hypothetical protein